MSDPAQAATATPPYRLSFICTGNICRSPMAEVVFRHLAGQVALDRTAMLADRVEASSAGTGNWHRGEAMDRRAAAALSRRGYRDHGHRARHISVEAIERLDLVVALDRRHQQTVRSLVGHRRVDERVALLRAFDPAAGGAVDVPDPYYDDRLFDTCLDMIEAGCAGLADALAHELGRAGRDASAQLPTS